MTLPNKPSIKNVWATSGVKVEPSDAKVNTGWIVERPPHQFQNFLQNRSDQFLKHINEAGIPLWDDTTVYTAGKSYAQGSDGKIYKCLVDGFNENPVGNPTKWMLTFGDIDILEYVDQAEDSAIAAAASEATALATLAVFDDVPPASPFQGRHWTDSDTGKTYEWIIDADSGQWVEVGSPTAVTGTAFAAYLATSNGASLVGTQQSGIGAVLRTVASKFAEIVTVTDYDQGDTDDAMVARAVAYCKTLSYPSRLILPPRNYVQTDTWTFDLPNHSTIEFLGKITSNVSAKTAIRIGSLTTNYYGYLVTGINVVRSSYDLTSGSVGIEIANVFASSISTRVTTGFTDGILVNGTQANGGCSYLDLTIGYCVNNKRNIRFTASGAGYCNEMNVFGGRYGYSSDYPDYTGTANLTIDHFVTARLNNLRFYGPSFEAVNAATRAAVISGRYCLIVHPRMENSADVTGFAIEFTANSEGNVVDGKGFGLNTSNIIDAGLNNSYTTKQTTMMRREAPTDTPILDLQSNAGNNAYSLRGKRLDNTSGWWIRQSGEMFSNAKAYFETGLRWSSSDGTWNDRGLFSGNGSPEGVIAARIGSIYSRKDGGVGTSFYMKESGTGNTGWIATTTASALSAGTGSSLIGSQYTETGSYLRTQKEINEDWIDVLGFIPVAERAAIIAGTTTYDATANLVAAAVVAIALGKGLRAAYWGKLFCASNADLRGVKNIDIPGPIQMGTSGTPAMLTVGGGANSSNWSMKFGDVTNGTSVLTVAPPVTPVMRIFGLKRSSVTIGSCNYLQLWADSAVSTGNSTAYNQIYLNGAQSKVELTDTGTGAWINENTFHGGGIQRLFIVGVGYPHNHNKFNRPVFEGSSVQLVYTNCSSNLIEDGRFEGVSGSSGWTCSADTYLNKIIVSWSGTGVPRADYQLPTTFPVNDLGMDNVITTRAIMTHRKNRLFSVGGHSLIVGNASASASTERAVNPARFDNQIRAIITPSLKGFTSGANRVIAISDRIPVSNGDTVVFDGDFDGSLARAMVFVYDADMNLLTSEGGGGAYFSAAGFSYTAASGSYGHGIDQPASSFNGLAGSVVRSEVKYIRVRINSATGGFFRSIGASLYSRQLLQPSGQEGAASIRPIGLSLAGVPTNGFAPEGTPIYDSISRRNGVNVFSWETQLTGALAAGATSATVNTILTVANADIVGILLTDGMTHWTTVSGLSGSTFTIAAIPVGKSALAGAPVVFNRWVYEGGITTVTATTTLTATSTSTLLADATAGAFSVNLPTAATAVNQTINIKKIDSSANAVTIDPSGAETIDGATTLVLATQWQSAQIQSNGTAWYIL